MGPNYLRLRGLVILNSVSFVLFSIGKLSTRTKNVSKNLFQFVTVTGYNQI